MTHIEMLQSAEDLTATMLLDLNRAGKYLNKVHRLLLSGGDDSTIHKCYKEMASLLRSAIHSRDGLFDLMRDMEESGVVVDASIGVIGAVIECEKASTRLSDSHRVLTLQDDNPYTTVAVLAKTVPTWNEDVQRDHVAMRDMVRTHKGLAECLYLAVKRSVANANKVDDLLSNIKKTE